jgi:hypothetical protein
MLFVQNVLLQSLKARRYLLYNFRARIDEARLHYIKISTPTIHVFVCHQQFLVQILVIRGGKDTVADACRKRPEHWTLCDPCHLPVSQGGKTGFCIVKHHRFPLEVKHYAGIRNTSRKRSCRATIRFIENKEVLDLFQLIFLINSFASRGTDLCGAN